MFSEGIAVAGSSAIDDVRRCCPVALCIILHRLRNFARPIVNQNVAQLLENVMVLNRSKNAWRLYCPAGSIDMQTCACAAFWIRIICV